MSVFKDFPGPETLEKNSRTFKDFQGPARALINDDQLSDERKSSQRLVGG